MQHNHPSWGWLFNKPLYVPGRRRGLMLYQNISDLMDSVAMHILLLLSCGAFLKYVLCLIVTGRIAQPHRTWVYYGFHSSVTLKCAQRATVFRPAFSLSVPLPLSLATFHCLRALSLVWIREPVSLWLNKLEKKNQLLLCTCVFTHTHTHTQSVSAGD